MRVMQVLARPEESHRSDPLVTNGGLCTAQVDATLKNKPHDVRLVAFCNWVLGLALVAILPAVARL